jgi:hypothetical protein
MSPPFSHTVGVIGQRPGNPLSGLNGLVNGSLMVIGKFGENIRGSGNYH